MQNLDMDAQMTAFAVRMWNASVQEKAVREKLMKPGLSLDQQKKHKASLRQIRTCVTRLQDKYSN